MFETTVETAAHPTRLPGEAHAVLQMTSLSQAAANGPLVVASAQEATTLRGQVTVKPISDWRHLMHLRTKAMRSAFACGMILAMGACGSGGGSTDGPLIFATAGGSGLVAQEQSWLIPWAKQSGVRVETNPTFDPVKIVQMVDSDNVQWDVAAIDGPSAHAMCGEYLTELDMSKIDTTHFTPEARAASTPCSVPSEEVLAVLAWNRDTVKEPLASWADFFNPDIPGVRAVPGAGLPRFVGVYEIAMVAAGKPAYPIDYSVALAQYEKIREHIVYYETGAQIEQFLQAGTVDMAIAAAGLMEAADASNPDFKYDFTWKNASLWFDQFAIPKGAPHVDQAHSLLNYIVSPEAQAAHSALIALGPVTEGTKPNYVSASVEKYSVSSEQRADAGFIAQDGAWWAENLTEALDTWTAFITR
jgi:putative spermidine/putrescine transport system substrate-binding protein